MSSNEAAQGQAARRAPKTTGLHNGEAVPGRREGRPDHRRSTTSTAPSVASPPSTSSTSRSRAARSPRSSARTVPARRRSSTCSPDSTSPTPARGRSTAPSLAGIPAFKVARLGQVRTFQLTKALGLLTVLDNMKLGAKGQSGERFWPALPVPFWRTQEEAIEERAIELLASSSSTPRRRTTPRPSPAGSASCSRWLAPS